MLFLLGCDSSHLCIHVANNFCEAKRRPPPLYILTSNKIVFLIREYRKMERTILSSKNIAVPEFNSDPALVNSNPKYRIWIATDSSASGIIFRGSVSSGLQLQRNEHLGIEVIGIDLCWLDTQQKCVAHDLINLSRMNK